MNAEEAMEEFQKDIEFQQRFKTIKVAEPAAVESAMNVLKKKEPFKAETTYKYMRETFDRALHDACKSYKKAQIDAGNDDPFALAGADAYQLIASALYGVTIVNDDEFVAHARCLGSYPILAFAYWMHEKITLQDLSDNDDAAEEQLNYTAEEEE